MLELKNITKDYPAGNGKVNALKGISIQFRRSEFVSILGPSGCGKTTTLNIIGGLDQYTSGDLVINGVSTTAYKDRDWDAYRNHSVGFVFQTYNLIPHQSVLQNVELALSLSGVSRRERRRRAIEALNRVGLGDQLRKKPGEMSGGQMQRVAIARAIVNDPDIILADEPTGALDTETSVQVLDILKEISRDRLVIMVTHNPELAEHYSTRIIRMLDGVITSDSSPLTEEEAAAEREQEKSRAEVARRERMPSMSFFTSFTLSLKNLFTKRSRTILTSFAGSIGIIGIALIYAVSQGTTNYIDAIQEETLSAYPLTLEATHMDMGSLLETFMGTTQSAGEHEMDAVYQKSVIYEMINALNGMEKQQNDLAAFKLFVEAERADENSASGLYDAVTGVQYTYDFDLQVLTKNAQGQVSEADTRKLMQEILLENLGMDVTSLLTMSEETGMMSSMTSMSSMNTMGASVNLWQEMLPGDNGTLINPVVEKQYELVYGQWPNDYDEVLLVLDDKNELNDLTLYALGLRTKEEINKMVGMTFEQSIIEVENLSWSYEEVCGIEFHVVLPSDRYRYSESQGVYIDYRDVTGGLEDLYAKGIPLKITGVIRPKEDVTAPMISSALAYTSALTEHLISAASDSGALQAQLADPTTDIFTGLPFRDSSQFLSEEEKANAFIEHVRMLDEAGMAEVYRTVACIPTEAEINSWQQMFATMTRDELLGMASLSMSGGMGNMGLDMGSGMGAMMDMSEADVMEYLSAMSEENLRTLFASMAVEQQRTQYAQAMTEKLKDKDSKDLARALEKELKTYNAARFAEYYDEVMKFSDSSYEANLRLLGYADPDSPATINLYAASFEDKDRIEEAIAQYNAGVDEFEQIVYTDYVGLMMSSVTTIINAITYVLIAFVAVSLIVSSIMIGVITLISVQERTKEIGILRAIGASKRNVSSMFNAETVIIGFSSGLMGIIITYLLLIPINAILHKVTGIGNLSAHLPIVVGLTLIAISMVLTLIAGIIPSRSAARKDPVVALRSE